jgi:outer membrane protein
VTPKPTWLHLSHLLVLALLLASVGVVPSQAAEALTLDDYFAAALQRSEGVAIQSELIQQAEERYRQANSTLLPTLTGIASYTWLEPTSAGSSSTSNNPTRQPHARLSATQPLFRGFREFAALRQNKALLGAQNQDYRNAQVQLFKDTAQNFFDILAFEQDLKNLDEQISQNAKRETELRNRTRIGRARPGEVLTVQSTISTLRAEVERLQGQLQAAREVLAFLSGLDATTPLRDTETLPATLEPLAEYLAQLPRRPDVQASRQRFVAADEAIGVQRGARLPSLDLNANHYLERRGSLADVDWDVQIALSVPIYAGGVIQSRVREAASQRNQAELTASQVKRQAEQEIRATYQSVVFDRTQLEALEKATDAARKNYEAQLRDYRLGLVTNLDVLQALTTFQENQRALDRARFQAKADYLKLQAAAMRRPALMQEHTP